MFETDDEVAHLQRLLDAHLAHANPHMTSIVTAGRRLNARQVVRYLTGVKHLAFATVTTQGEPRVSPLDSLFIHGRFSLSTGGQASKLEHLRRHPGCSAVHMDADRVAVAVNGTVEWIPRQHPEHADLHRVWSETYRSDPYSWGDEIVFFRIEPRSMWSYAFHPEEFPE